jgi:site-specific DNA-methyltransferase (adenine-specific)
MSCVTSLPSGMKFNRQQSYDLEKWMIPVAEKIFRILKPGSFFCVFSSPRLYHRVACSIEDAGFEIRDMYEWLYLQNQPKAMSLTHVIEKRKVDDVKKQELKTILDKWKTPQVKSNHEPIVFAMKPTDSDFLNNYDKYHVGLVNTENKIGSENNMFPSNVLCDSECDESLQKHFLVSKPSKSEKGNFNNHKTVKPLALCEYLIALTTREGQCVLDPFAGSGSILVAAKNIGRKYYGIELNEEYYKIIRQRVGII